MNAATLQERMKGLFPDLIGPELVEVTPECVKARLEVKQQLCTEGGVLHGGAIMEKPEKTGQTRISSIGHVIGRNPGLSRFLVLA